MTSERLKTPIAFEYSSAKAEGTKTKEISRLIIANDFFM
jgi:hypothetical protein